MKKPSHQKRAASRKHRQVFTESGAYLRQMRHTMVAMCYDELTDLSVSATRRNELLGDLVELLVTDGLYAKPPAFNIDKPGSWMDIRWGIGRLLWREWIGRENARLKAEGSKTQYGATDWRTWMPWCNTHGWSLKGRWFIKPVVAKSA